MADEKSLDKLRTETRKQFDDLNRKVGNIVVSGDVSSLITQLNTLNNTITTLNNTVNIQGADITALEAIVAALNVNITMTGMSMDIVPSNFNDFKTSYNNMINILNQYIFYVNVLNINDPIQDGRLTALEAVVSDETTQNNRLTALEASVVSLTNTNVSQNSRLTALENADVATSAQITAINALNTTQTSRLDGIDVLNVTQNNRLTNLETQDAAQSTINTTVNTRLNTAEAYIVQLIAAANIYRSAIKYSKLGSPPLAGLNPITYNTPGGVPVDAVLGRLLFDANSGTIPGVTLSYDVVTDPNTMRIQAIGSNIAKFVIQIVIRLDINVTAGTAFLNDRGMKPMILTKEDLSNWANYNVNTTVAAATRQIRMNEGVVLSEVGVTPTVYHVEHTAELVSAGNDIYLRLFWNYGSTYPGMTSVQVSGIHFSVRAAATELI